MNPAERPERLAREGVGAAGGRVRSTASRAKTMPMHIAPMASRNQPSTATMPNGASAVGDR